MGVAEISNLHCRQCNRMARLLFQNLANYSIENLPNNISNLPEYVQNFAKYLLDHLTFAKVV